MKIAYIIPINFNQYDGVVNKINSQVSAWKNLSHEVRVIILTNQKEYPIEKTAISELYLNGLVEVFIINKIGIISIDLLKDWLSLKSVFSDALKYIISLDPDIIYTRNSLYQPFYYNLGKRYKLIVEVNTNISSEFHLERFHSPKYFGRFLYYKLTHFRFLKSVSGIAAVTKEISLLYSDIHVDVFPNSIDIDKYDISEYTYNFQQNHVAFIGTPGMPWQGIDLLLSIASNIPNVIFNVIGFEGSKYPDYPENVIFHGFLKKKEYLDILRNCNAAIGTLALFRKNMEEACPLKVREYIACCRPVILAYKETAFEQHGYPEWVLQIQNDKISIMNSITKIQLFLEQCKNFKIKKECNKKYVDISHIEHRRLTFFEKVLNSSS